MCQYRWGRRQDDELKEAFNKKYIANLSKAEGTGSMFG